MEMNGTSYRQGPKSAYSSPSVCESHKLSPTTQSDNERVQTPSVRSPSFLSFSRNFMNILLKGLGYRSPYTHQSLTTCADNGRVLAEKVGFHHCIFIGISILQQANFEKNIEHVSSCKSTALDVFRSPRNSFKWDSNRNIKVMLYKNFLFRCNVCSYVSGTAKELRLHYSTEHVPVCGLR